MIHAYLKSLMCSDFDLRTYVPESPDDFGFQVELEIGVAGTEGADLFQIFVCTPRWMEHEVGDWGAQWNHAKLMVNSYDFNELERLLTDTVNSIQGRDWTEIVAKLRLMAHWEFDGYA